MSKVEITPADVIKILEAMINFMDITLLGEALTPNADMEREENVNRLNMLIEKLNHIKDVGFQKVPPQKQASVKQSRKSEKREKPPRSESTGSSYMDMNQGSPNLVTKDTPTHAVKPIKQEKVQPEPIPVEEEQEDYEVPNSGFVQDAVSNKSQEEVISYEELMKKVKNLEKFTPNELKENCTYSGYLLKHKKRVLTKWHKRFCILRDDFLFYFKTETDDKEQGIIILPGYTFAVPPKDKGYLFMLESVDKTRDSYMFQADHKDEFEQWKKHINVITSKTLSTEAIGIMNKVAGEHLEDSYEGGSIDQDNEAENNPEQGELYDDVANITQPPIDQEIYDDVDAGGGASVAAIHPQQTLVTDEIYDDVDAGGGASVAAIHPQQTLVTDMIKPIEDTDGEVYEFIAGQTQPSIPPRQQPPPSPQPRQKPPSSPHPVNLPMRIPVSPPADAPLSPQFIPPRPSTKNLPIGPHFPPRAESPMPSPNPSLTGQDQFSISNIFIGLYDCQGDDKDDLTFNRGDILYKMDEIDMNWWVGYLNGKVGLVPSNFLVEAFE